MSQGSSLKFVVDIQNEEKIEQLTKDINVQEAAIKKLSSQLRQGAISEQQFIAATTPMGAAIAKSTQEMHALQGASAMTGRGLLQLGYAVDDLAYGFSAIVNNIPQIAMGFGAGAGVAGAIAIAAVAVNQLIKHWGDLSDIASSYWSGGSIEQLHKLREAAEEAAKGFKKLQEEHTKMEEATAKYTKEAIVEAGVDKVRKAVAEALTTSPTGEQMTEEEKRLSSGKMSAFEEMRAGVMGGGANPAEYYRSQAAQRIADENRKEADRLVFESTQAGPQGDLARKRLKGLGNLPADVMKTLDPEAAEKDRVDRLNLASTREGQKNVRAAEKKAEEERIHANKELTDKGIQYEKEGKKELLETERRDLQEAIKRGEHMLTGEGKKQLQDKLLGGVAPISSSMLSGKAMADKRMLDSFNKVPEKQLKKLADMHMTLKDIDKKMRVLGLQ